MKTLLKWVFLSTQALVVACILAFGGMMPLCAFGEVQTKLGMTLPTMTNPGAGGSFTATASSGPAASGGGTVTKTYGGVMQYLLSSGTGRFSTLTGSTRYGVSIDSFQILQSFLTSNHFTLMSSNTTCPASPTGTLNWILIRLRSQDATRDPMDLTSNALSIAGRISYDSTATPKFAGSGVINLNQTSLTASSYSLNGFSGATCSSGSMLVQASASTPLDSYGSVMFGSSAVVYISQSGNPLIALALPQTTLTSGTMSALSGQAFTGLYTAYDSNTSQTRKNIVLVPDSNGTTFSIQEVSDLTNPLTRTTVGSFTCTSLNSPANGFCSGILTLSGVSSIYTGKVICEYGEVGSPVLACVAQKHGDTSIGITIVSRVLDTSTLAVTVSPLTAGVASVSNTANLTATLTNLSGRKIPTVSQTSTPGLQLSAPFALGGTAFAGSSSSGGSCGTTLNAYGTCTVPVTFTPSTIGAFNQLLRVAYDDGTGTVNATASTQGTASLSSITITPTTGFYAGNTKQLTATAHYSDLSTQDITALVAWTVNAPTVGAVDSAGLFTGTALGGSITITATAGSVSANISPTVAIPWTGTKLTGLSSLDGVKNSTTTEGHGIAVDSSDNLLIGGNTTGNIDTNIVTGSTDFLITKYSSTGTKLWSKQLGATGKIAYGYSLTSDAGDNALITGSTTGGLDGNTQTGTTDLYVSKYNSSGVKQWTQQLGVASANTISTDVVTDASNSVYLSGYTTGALDGNSLTGSRDLFIIKYNSSGTKQWTQLLGVSAVNTAANAIAVDGSNNVYATGYTSGGLDGNSLTGTQDFFLTKYNSAGAKQWTRQLGISTKSTTGNAVTLDAGSNIYVAGHTNGNLDGNTLAGTQDLFVTKYNSAGTKQWTKTLGIATKSTSVIGITRDGSNNIYLSGITAGNLDGNTLTGTQDFILTKYDSAGNKQWTKQMGVATKATYGRNVVRDSTDKISIVGYTTGGIDGNTIAGSYDMFVVQYDSSGTKQWSRQLGAITKSTSGYAIARDLADSVYLAGITTGSLDGATTVGSQDAFITKYDSAGTKQWTVQLNAGTGKSVNAYDMVSDASNNIYVTGDTDNGLDGNAKIGSVDFFVTKYDSSGTRQWTRTLGAASKYAYGTSIAIDGGNNVYVGGRTNANLDGNTLIGGQDFFITKYNSSGTKQWTVQLGATPTKTIWTYGLACDGGNNVYISGWINGDLDGNTLTGTNDIFLTKYNSSGVKQWTKQLGVAAANTTTSSGIATDSSNNIYVGATTNGSFDSNTLTGSTDLLLVKYDSAGTKQWTKQLGAATKNTTPWDVTRDSLDNVYVTGYTEGSLDGNTLAGTRDFFLTKYDSAGTKQWTKQLGVASQLTFGRSVTVDSEDSAFVAGYTNGNLDGTTWIGRSDAFVTKYNSAGTKQ